MIFTDYSQHIPKITANPMCTAIKNDINSIKLCLSYSQSLKIQVVHFFKCSSFWGTPTPGPLPGLCPRTPLGDFRPPDPLICPPPTPPSRSAPDFATSTLSWHHKIVTPDFHNDDKHQCDDERRHIGADG